MNILKSIEHDLMIIINRDSPELDDLYKKLVLNDYSEQFETQEIEFVTKPLERFKHGPIQAEIDENFTTSHYSE